jgi:hypothetical protein
VNGRFLCIFSGKNIYICYNREKLSKEAIPCRKWNQHWFLFLQEKKLFPYIPFYIARYEKELATEYDTKDNTENAVRDLEYFRNEMIRLHEENELSDDEIVDLMGFVNTIITHITNGNKNEERLVNVMDDVFFQKMAEDMEVAEEILRIILEKPKLKVIENQVQRFLRNTGAHSIILDLLCEDEDHSFINCEIQKADDDDHQKRVRFNRSNIDTVFVEKGIDYKELPDVYIIFISKFDPFEENRTIYHINRVIEETGTVVENGTHEIYVNTAIDDKSDIAELMQYFNLMPQNGNKVMSKERSGLRISDLMHHRGTSEVYKAVQPCKIFQGI